MMRRVKHFLGIDDKPMSPRERIKRQKADLRNAQMIERWKIEKRDKRRKIRQSRNQTLADEHAVAIANNCILAMDKAAKKGCGIVAAYIELQHPKTRHFKEKHWKTIVDSLVGYGYDVGNGVSGKCLAFDVTTGASGMVHSTSGSVKGPIKGGVPITRRNRADDSDSSEDIYYCYYYITIRD
jgi:hypothetical protein